MLISSKRRPWHRSGRHCGDRSRWVMFCLYLILVERRCRRRLPCRGSSPQRLHWTLPKADGGCSSQLGPNISSLVGESAQLRQAYAHAEPDTPPLMFQKAQFLASVGRTAEALDITDRLIAISPLLPSIQSLHANLLAARGRPDAATRAADHASSLWPRDRLSWFTRCDIALYGGRPRDALAIGAERSRWPAGSTADIADRVSIAHALIDPSSRSP